MHGIHRVKLATYVHVFPVFVTLALAIAPFIANRANYFVQVTVAWADIYFASAIFIVAITAFYALANLIQLILADQAHAHQCDE